MTSYLPTYLYACSFLTGSTYICDPPVTNTDIDIMHLVKDLSECEKYLLNNGWTLCTGLDSNERYNGSNWAAYKKDNLNALITNDISYFMKFQQATEKAKKLNLLKKEDRIAFFKEFIG